ncbi:MAG: ADOP family duplicated permease [Candidatus Acidiferrales bacterium]
MRWLATISLRMRSLFHRRAADEELDAELRFHVERQIAVNIAAGMPTYEARREAMREFGGVEGLKEECRGMRKINWIQDIVQDTRYGMRMLCKAPGFTAIAILTLALGIGANAAIFSAVNGILLKPLPYADASRLVKIMGEKRMGDALVQFSVSNNDVQSIKTQCSAFEGVAAYQDAQFDQDDAFTFSAGTSPERVNGAQVSGDFFAVMGVRPLLGRAILPADTQTGQGRIVVVSYATWKNLLGDDPNVIGRQVKLNGKPYSVIGVMPPEFDFPNSAQTLWVPLLPDSADAKKPIADNDWVIARLKQGVRLEAARTQLKTLSTRHAGQQGALEQSGLLSRSELIGSGLGEYLIGNVLESLVLLLAAVGLVLLIACVNVSGLLLFRGWSRQKEVAIREALGATRLRIARQFLVESMLLGLAGGAVGLLLSVWGIRLLQVVAPPDTPRLDQLRLDSHVLWFTLGISVLSGLLFGLAPAVRVSASRIGMILKQTPGSGHPRRQPRRLGSGLVVFEIALAVILVVGATLVARGFERLRNVNLGFRTDHVLTMKAHFSKSVCDETKVEACQLILSDILKRMRALPEVQDVAAASAIPMNGASLAYRMHIEGQAQDVGLANGNEIGYKVISADYFRTMGIHVVAGREFHATDTKGGVPVALVNESFAKKYLSGKPVGKHISFVNARGPKSQEMEVVGEVSDDRALFGPEVESGPEFYVPFLQSNRFIGGNLIIRTAADPMNIASAAREQVWAVDKNAPITDLLTLDQIVYVQEATPRFHAVLLGSFGVLGLLLALIGIYGVVSFSVGQRTHEIGIRMALGAQRTDVMRMVLRESMLLAAIGIVTGVAGALALTRYLRSLLFEIKPTDPVTFISVAILLAMVAFAACYIPARRAMRVDPMVALRHE